jgi:peptide/nickel transport system permease protein
MASFVVRRLLQGIIVIVGVSVIVFFVTRVIGDPVRHMLPLEATPEQYTNLKHALGFDRPLPEQFVDFAKSLPTLDFGDSLWQRGIPARDLVLQRLPASLLLIALGMGLAVLIAIPLGCIAALRPGSLLDRATVTTSLIGLSVPQFWLGLLLVLLFSVTLGWLPSSGPGGLDHAIMPALTLALPAAGRLTQIVRSSMIDELGRQYVVTAQAKGMSYPYILARHALRNAFLPVLTLTSWETIRALAGYSVVVETVFQWPGIGWLTMQAIDHQDVVLIQATVFTAALLVVLINILTDFLYTRLDPRVSY